MYKGRCSNLARDVELHYNQLNKTNTDKNASSEQVRILAERANSLENDYEEMRQQRNEA
jgi:hypothetical protein